MMTARSRDLAASGYRGVMVRLRSAAALIATFVGLAGTARAASPFVTGGEVPAGSSGGAAKSRSQLQYEALGRLEKEAVDDALAWRGLALEPAPAGKRVGVVHVYNHEVFSRKDSYFQLLNYLHRTTREEIIRREVLLLPGDPYVEALVEETGRNLRQEDVSSLVIVLPVKGTQADHVDLLVVTRDVWSLRFNTEFDFGEGELRSLSTSLSENNLLGWRKRASFAYLLGRGAYAIGPTYFDPNVAGSRLTFSGSYRAYYTRETNQREGTSVGARVSYPLFSLASRWGASLGASYANTVARNFLGGRLRTLDLRATPERDDLPYIYRVRSASVDSQIVRSFGKAVIQRVAVGHTLSSVRPRFLKDYPLADPQLQTLLGNAIFPRSERISQVYLSYSLFTPRYRVYRDFSTYDLGEDVILGPSLSGSVARAVGWLGSEAIYTSVSAGAAWTFDYGNGYQKIGVGWSGARRFGELVDEYRSASVYLATPMLWRAFRLVADASTGALIDNRRSNVRETVGAETSLRAYATGEFEGQAAYMAHFEVRSAPIAVAAFRLGLVAFHDMGHAARKWTDLGVKQDAGLGLRLLIPQLNFYVLRVDWAVAFQDGTRDGQGHLLTAKGLPGRISAGFRQAF